MFDLFTLLQMDIKLNHIKFSVFDHFWSTKMTVSCIFILYVPFSLGIVLASSRHIKIKTFSPLKPLITAGVHISANGSLNCSSFESGCHFHFFFFYISCSIHLQCLSTLPGRYMFNLFTLLCLYCQNLRLSLLSFDWIHARES